MKLSRRRKVFLGRGVEFWEKTYKIRKRARPEDTSSPTKVVKIEPGCPSGCKHQQLNAALLLRATEAERKLALCTEQLEIQTCGSNRQLKLSRECVLAVTATFFQFIGPRLRNENLF